MTGKTVSTSGYLANNGHNDHLDDALIGKRVALYRNNEDAMERHVANVYLGRLANPSAH